MEPENIILLYSKYSNACKSMISALQQRPINYLQQLCIDNSEVRKRILGSKSLIIETVPCILIVFSNGTVEKYDGERAFNWIRETIIKLYPPPPNPRPPPQQQAPPQPKQQVQKQQQQDQQQVQQVSPQPSTQTSQLRLQEHIQETNIVKPNNVGHHISQPMPNGGLPSSNDGFRPDGMTDSNKAVKTTGKVNIKSAVDEMQRQREASEPPNQKAGLPPRPPS